MTSNKAFAKYTEIIDLHTESDKVGVIGIHTPTDYTPHKMFDGFFKQFKKFKYLGCSISLVPAARLPADPLQVSYEAGETTIDPRDMLNPIMFHGCHGNDLGNILNRLYTMNSNGVSGGFATNIQESDSIVKFEEISNSYYDNDLLENLYYKALTDRTWKKAHPQRGFRKSGLRPLVYQLATNVQIAPPTVLGPIAGDGAVKLQNGAGMPTDFYMDEPDGQSTVIGYGVSPSAVQMFTPRLTGLGWLDTRNVITTAKSDATIDWTDQDAVSAYVDGLVQTEVNATLPKIFMGCILLPPAYKTEQYFRMLITHRFAFKDFRGISFANEIVSPPVYNFNDSDYEYESDGPPSPDDPGSGGSGGGDEPGGGELSGAMVVELGGFASPNHTALLLYDSTGTLRTFYLDEVYVVKSITFPDNTTWNWISSSATPSILYIPSAGRGTCVIKSFVSASDGVGTVSYGSNVYYQNAGSPAWYQNTTTGAKLATSLLKSESIGSASNPSFITDYMADNIQYFSYYQALPEGTQINYPSETRYLEVEQHGDERYRNDNDPLGER